MRFRRHAFLALVAGVLLSLVTPATARVPWAGFEDVPPSSIFYADITWLHDQGITKGCNPPENTLFCPGDAVTRGQMAAFLVRALDLPKPAKSDWFQDDDNSVFEQDIDRLAAAGITKGCNPPANTNFCPDDPVSRGQMASFLTRALGLQAGVGMDWFADDDSSVHQTAIDRLRAAWITFGCNPPTEDQFCPNESVTREQMAAFLRRALSQPQSGAAIGVHSHTWPDPLYMYADMVATIEVRNTGSLVLDDVTAYVPVDDEYGDPLGDCYDEDAISGPVERLGNGDLLLDPGEIWDWYCGMPSGGLWGSMFFESRGTADGINYVTDRVQVEYQLLDPLTISVTASATSVEVGGQVTWTIRLQNPSPLKCVRVSVEARENRQGSYTYFDRPEMELVGNGDDVMDPGEVWEYTYTASLWTDTFLDVTGGYAPAWSPGTGTGLASVTTDTVVVTTP